MLLIGFQCFCIPLHCLLMLEFLSNVSYYKFDEKLQSIPGNQLLTMGDFVPTLPTFLPHDTQCSSQHVTMDDTCKCILLTALLFAFHKIFLVSVF